MTGLSVLFNLNTDEACYIYGNMDAYRRMNEQSRHEGHYGNMTNMDAYRRMNEQSRHEGHYGNMTNMDAYRRMNEQSRHEGHYGNMTNMDAYRRMNEQSRHEGHYGNVTNMDAYRRMNEQSRHEGHYGNMTNMDSYRRTNEQPSRQERYTGSTTDRSRSYRDVRYVPSSELSTYPTHYTELEPRYRSQYGLHTDSHRDLYQTYPGVNTNNFSVGVNSNLYSDGGVSTYPRHYGVRNTHIDIATKSFDSTRLFERKSPVTDRATLELGTDFRRRYHSDKTHDVTVAGGYSRDSGTDVSTISPARSKSLRDHERHKEEPVETLRPPSGRQRINSNDSTCSQTSERSDKGDNSKALFKAYQNRYKEHADETPTKTPFSSWRRSGNFEEDSKSVDTKAVEPERSRVEMKGRVFVSSEESTRHGHEKRDLKPERIKTFEKPEKEKDVVSPKQKEGDKGDELMSNFRQALHRHQISEERKVSEERDSSKDTEKSTAAMIEKIRAAKAQIKQMKESHAKSDDSKDTTVSHERNKIPSTSSVEESVSKTVPKLARQKLVSDDLKAKYVESKKEEKVKEETVRPKDTEIKPGKHARLKTDEQKQSKSYSRLKEKENKEKEKSEQAVVKTSETEQTKVTQDRKDFRKAIAEKFKRDSAGFEFGTSFTKPKSVETKDDDQKSVSSDKNVDKTEQRIETDKIPEPAKSVYKFVPKTEQTEETVKVPETAKSVYKFVPKTDKTVETAASVPKTVPKTSVLPVDEAKDYDFSQKPVSSLVYQEPTSSSTQVLGYKRSKDKEIDQSENVDIESKAKDTGHKPRRQMKKHTKAKSFELGLLSKPTEEKTEVLETQDDSLVPNLNADELSRKERIDKYKEERKKQLATIFVGGDSEMPSLFLSSRPETDSGLSRSRSLKVDSDNKTDSAMAPVRSKSMKEASPAHVSKISGLQLAELGSQSKDTYEKQSRDEIARPTVKSASAKDQKDSKEITHRTMLAEMVLAEDKEQALRSSFEKETDSGHESTDSSRRIRRKLPSLEDVLGKSDAENKNDEKKPDVKQQYTELKKPKDNERVKPPAEFSLDYSKVKITPKSIPVEMSQGRVISKKFDIIQPEEEPYNSFLGSDRNTYQTSETDDRNKFNTAEAEASFEDLGRSFDQKDTSSELTDSEIPKDAVSKMSQYFMQSEKQDRPESMVFASVYSKQKTETDVKPTHEAVRKYPSEEDERFRKDYDVSVKQILMPEKAVISEELVKETENRSRSSTPERVISISEAKKVFSESSTKQVFGTDYVHKEKEPEKPVPSKYTKTLAEIDSVFKDTETELKRQLLLGARSSSAEHSDSVIDRTQSSHTQQRSRSRQHHEISSSDEARASPVTKPPVSPRQHHEISSSDEARASPVTKPPVSPRTERKRAKDTRFKKVSYRSSENDENRLDAMKERESSKSRELSKEKEIQRHIASKERSPSLESIPKADVRITHAVKERSPSTDNIPKVGVTKISYRDLERARQEKLGHESSSGGLVFWSDYRKPVTKPDNMSYTEDYSKTKNGVITEENFESIQSFNDYDDKAETMPKEQEIKPAKLVRDVRKFQIETGSEAMVFGSDYRKPKADIKAEIKGDHIHDNLQKNIQARHFEQATVVAQPAIHKIDMKETHKATDEKVNVPNVQAGYASKEEKMHVFKPAEAKIDIKAEAVSAASGQIFEMPVSPRQKSPPKIVSLSKQETVPKIEVKPEIKLISKPKSVEETKVLKAPAQVTVEKQVSEPKVEEQSDKVMQDAKPKVVPFDRQTVQLTKASEITEKVKPVQYVHPSPLLSFSAKTETPKKTGLVTETKVTSKEETKTEEIKPAVKDDDKLDRVRESDKEFISKRAKEEEWKKPVDTTSEFHKKTVEKMLLDTSLDDILSRNVDYLSDSEKTSGSGRGRAEKKARPQSVHEESRSHGRTKRIFKKKNLQRSKSEDRSHFKVDDSGAVRRSRGTEDIEKSKKHGPGGVSRSHDSRTRRTFLQRDITSTDTDSTSSERVSRFDGRRKPKSEGKVEKVLVKASGIVDKSRTTPNDTVVDKIRSVPNEPQTGSSVTDEVFGKVGENVENQTGFRDRIESSDKDLWDTVSDIVTQTQSSMDLLSASDTSDFLDRQNLDDAKEGSEGTKRLATPESELSAASSSISDGARRRRKDKSSLRKSKLNESSDDSVTRRRDDPAHMNKIGVRRVSSSRLARESRDDKYKEEADRRLQEAENLTNKRETSLIRESSLNRRNRNLNQSNSLSSAQNKSLNNLDQITSSHSRVIHSTALDSKTVLPSRFALPSKVSSAISKLSEASDRASREGSAGPRDERTPSPRGIRRGNNFSELLQKFSSSDASGSEKSDTDSLSHAVRKPFLTRQEACALSSSTSSEETRRTPERTQSLRLRGSRSAAMEKESSPVQRSSSFKSDFMKQRFSPEPEQRRRLPETPVKQTNNVEKSDKTVSEKFEKVQKPVTEEMDKTPKHGMDQSDKYHKAVPEQFDKPSPELASVLSKRSEIVQKQQETGVENERRKILDGNVEKADTFTPASVDDVIADSEVARMLRSRRKETDTKEGYEQKIHDGKVEKADSFKPASVDEVIADSEVAKMLRSRRKETDSSIESMIDKETKSQAIYSQREIESEKLRSKSQTTEKSQIKADISKPVSQTVLESKVSLQTRSHGPKAEDHSVSIHDKTKEIGANVTATVPKLDMSSIDKSLAVLEHVTHELEDPDIDLKDEKEQKLHDALSNVHVDKQSEVVQFINSVQSDNLNVSHAVIQPKMSDSQLNVDTNKIEKARTTADASNNAIHDKEVSNLDAKIEQVKESGQNKKIEIERGELNKGIESKINGKHEESVRSESPSTAGTVDITNKSEIKRKITRDRTPERQSPSRSGPMRVTSHVKVSASSGLTRTESLGRTDSEKPKGLVKTSASSLGLTRTESVGRSESERPKGILKRTPSLHKTGVYVDPELANILKTRRAKHEDVEEELETQKLSAQEEIRRSRESQSSQDENGERQSVSVAERIFQMHTKIEEVKSCPITPKTRSGLTTPKSGVNKSGAHTPKSQFSFDESSTSKASPISGPQLIERLTSLEGQQQSAVRDRRNKYQQRRQQDDWRTRTQPVTSLEIQEADSLETVRKFRSEILHKASANVFENLQKEDKFLDKKTEFPQPFRKDRRPRGLRHKTLPVTAAELNAVPEDQIAETMNSIRRKFETFGARDSRADSGILSGSEVDMTERDADNLKSQNENIPEDDPIKLSVSAKASIFHQLEEKSKERDKKSASGAKRYIDRKKRERSRTQPITEEEVHTAAVKADEENAAENTAEDKNTAGEERTSNVMSEKDEVADEGQGDTDELSRQSLADKVKLFKQIEEKDKTVPKKAPPPPPKRRNRKLASRFATQPVTYEEVEKAAKISPLAMSLVKPPDPEMLAGMSVKAQREIMAEHAQKCLSQPGSRAGSRPVSRATSIGDLSGEPDNKGATKSDSDSKTDITSKTVPKENAEPKIVKKFDKDKTDFLTDKKSFRKSQELEKESEEVRSILKLDETSNEKSKGIKATRNVLKQQLEEKLTLHLKGEAKVKGLVKMDSESVRTTSEVESVIKAETVIETSNKPPEPKGILKKEGSFEQRNIDLDKVIAEIPKVPDISEQGGVSDDSLDNLDSDDNILSHSPTPEDDRNAESKDGLVRRTSKSRRRFNRERKLEAERYHTQPAEVKQDKEESPTRRKNAYAGRHLTQPITPTEKKQAEVATEMPEIQKTGSITDRLNALKKSGDEEWRKRVSKPSDLDALTPTKTPPQVKMREKKGLNAPRPSSIADRLTLLDTAQEGWRGRVGETDVKKFTIEHKLTASGQGQGESPLVARLRQKPKRDPSRESDTSETSDLPSPITPTKESSKIPLPREVICTDLPDDTKESQARPTTLATIKSMEEDEKKGPVNVEVPQIGEEIEEFFQSNRDSVMSEKGLNFDVDDFNELFLSANDILSSTRKIQPKRRHKASSRNPLKTMSMCLDVRSEYTEIITGVADKELKRIQTAKIAQGSGFAVEALAGLASKENFSKIELRKTESTGAGAGNTRHDPYLPLMLIHIKGRRKVQCRLVEPKASSLNSGDCFVVVTPDKIVQWIGDYCNVIEKAKAADVADFVKQKRDLGCKAHTVTSIDEKRSLMGSGKTFFGLIGGLGDYMNCGPQEEDELYENHIVDTNMVYRLEKNKLVPVEEYWGTQPKYEMLKPDQVFVFDFGSELYIWQGKSVTPAQRKIGLKLAEQLWDKGYDYSSCEVNPLCPLKTEDEGGLPMSADSRPDWALFGKVNQNMETILFREKFADWPDTSRLIKAKSNEEVSTPKFDITDLKPYDAKLMVPVNTSPVSLKLEGSHVGRGNKWEEDMEGFMRQQDIQTLKTVVWHVLEYDHSPVEEHSYGQFHEGDTYVIRWSYMIINAGMRSLKGEASRHTQLGRERCAYFFWQGKSSTINEKGASALMTVELDEERGPQVLVEEGKEPACFLNLFKGRMIIHIGKREEESTNTQGNWRFYCLRNEYENEMCLIEVPTEISSLRSVSSFLLLNVKNGALTVWHGCKSPDHTKKLALKAAENLKERCPLEVGLHKNVSIKITEVDEGCERTDFWRTMNVHIGDRSLYCSLLNNPESFNHTLRLFHMTSVSGAFEVHEIINPSRSPDLPTKFPVLQTDLYKASQPGLFLVDNGHEVYLWQGWWPEGDENQENVLTGSAQTRFTADRKCAIETTLHYCKEINPDSPPSAFVVYAGLEPLQFTNLFPFWTVDERVREINLKEGKQDGELVPVEELLKKVTKTRFTLAELQEPTLPEGVDPLKLESYLSDEEFQEVFNMNKEEFYALPGWKQQKVKQEAGLF